MTTTQHALAHLRRPRLLIRAAQRGLVDYNRRRDLKRVLSGVSVMSPSATVPLLMEREDALDALRQSGDASYSVVRHVETLIALMGEANLLAPRPTPA